MSTQIVEVWAGGVPVPQGSSIARITRDGRPFVAPDNSAALKRWRATVARAAELEWMLHRRWETEAVAIELEFFLLRPASVKRELPAVRPDLDKLCRAVLDALTGIAFKDDGQVVQLTARKVYRSDGPGVRIGAGLIRPPLDLPALE